MLHLIYSKIARSFLPCYWTTSTSTWFVTTPLQLPRPLSLGHSRVSWRMRSSVCAVSTSRLRWSHLSISPSLCPGLTRDTWVTHQQRGEYLQNTIIYCCCRGVLGACTERYAQPPSCVQVGERYCGGINYITKTDADVYSILYVILCVVVWWLSTWMLGKWVY